MSAPRTTPTPSVTHTARPRSQRARPTRTLRFGRQPYTTETRDSSRHAANVLFAVIGIVLTGPVMLVIAALVRLTSPGPIFYSQTRVGLDRRRGALRPPASRRQADVGGRPFTIFKFRTMYVHKTDDQVWATADDPRITPLGRVLRKYRLDELPQLFNVLLGDMNIVGPRPEQPKIFATLREQIEHYPMRQQVRPGITGWAQINHHYDRCLSDVQRKVELDLEYVERQSVIEDLNIMARTIPVVIFQRGAW